MELKTYFAQDELGNIVPDALCYLYQRGTENLASGLLKATGEGSTNPFKTGPDGKAQFAVANGLYDLRFVSNARDYRISIQCNDVTEDVAAAAAAANRAEVARDVAQLSSGIYPTVAIGLAGTQKDKYFSVPSPDISSSLILYRNDGATATEITRIPSVEQVNEIGRRTLITENLAVSRIPLVATEKGQVALWLEDGLLAAQNLAPALREAVTKDVISRMRSPNALMLPLMFTEAGQVVAWMKDGRFNAAGLHATIAELIQPSLASYQLKTQAKVTDGTGMFSYRAKIANALGGNGIARVVFTGDSWTEHLAETAQPLSKALYDAYGQSGQGWIGMDADEGGAASTLSQLLNGARLIKSSGWTLADMSLVTDSLDGHAAVATGTTETIAITNLKTQSLKWYYKDGDGAFRYTVDGGSPVTVTCGNTGTRKSIDLAGLTDIAHSIVFDLIGNTGTVTMYGGMPTRTAPGVEFSKAGNGGSTAVQWKVIAPYIQAYASELKPDVAIVILGTNDNRQNISKTDFKAGVQALANAYRVGSPNCCVVLVTPTMGGSTLDLGLMAGYAEAMYEISQATSGVEFLNLNAFMPPRVISDGMGMWADSNHLSEAGGRFVTGLLMKYFLKTN